MGHPGVGAGICFSAERCGASGGMRGFFATLRMTEQHPWDRWLPWEVPRLKCNRSYRLSPLKLG
jgi:hypothetical protein